VTDASSEKPVIFVLAGVNGAGKSSLGGEFLRESGLVYYNPDEFAHRILDATHCSVEEANSIAWNEGHRRLAHAIDHRESFAFESTLSGVTMTSLLIRASPQFDVRVWFFGLATPEQHIRRVRERVARGGHDIPEETIRKRWIDARRNITRLLPHLSELRVFDNSAEADGPLGAIPPPRLLLHWNGGMVAGPGRAALIETPDWAREIVEAALALEER
jgi:predicted ABC-type ATPase